MTPDPGTFGQDCVTASNSLDRVLSRYAHGIVFRTPRAVALVGTGVIAGKAALHDYRAKALDVAPHLRFELPGVYAGHGTLTVAYANHRGQRAAETCDFGPDGLVTRPAACYRE